MAFEIRNSPKQPGYALLVFDRRLEFERLNVSVLNLINRQFLGPSIPGKTNWLVARSHFFVAERVFASSTETHYRIGPEVTTYIPEETVVEFATANNTIKEQVAWRGITVDFGWSPPPPEEPPTAHVAHPSSPPAHPTGTLIEPMLPESVANDEISREPFAWDSRGWQALAREIGNDGADLANQSPSRAPARAPNEFVLAFATLLSLGGLYILAINNIAIGLSVLSVGLGLFIIAIYQGR